ncbi:right-handed parallel beta-helix repeat-containing protein [Candidatus Chloroploca asiatica]|uniref:DUF7619 domain-containing protein n=1 Tax=Candidatus Chloroploca asiatica TaxID=1506545 RepID=A0A2H3KQ78_9CHLR|nr:right-handed parallel beta-helix repeat-containing protein [Candidatus Chloroploca asiatica]PDV99606.1 hypothetical protein A9Q02_11710 [Candidatus Chloroploca asiatica]
MTERYLAFRTLLGYVGSLLLLILATLLASVLTPSPVAAETVITGNITENTTWTRANSPYIVGQAYIGAGVTLTIEPGVEVRFTSGGWLSTWPGAASTLIAEGTEDEPIIFTSAATSPQAGDWQYLYLYPTGAARLQHCIVEFAGGLTAIEVQSSDVSVRDCSIRDTSGYGIRLNGVGLTPTLERVTIERSSTAIYQTTLDMQPVYRELRLRTNQVNAIFVPSSSTTRDITLDSTGLVEGMLSLGQHYIGTGTTLTVQPGSVISFRSGGWLSTWPGAASTLLAEGTPGQPIRFTSAVTSPQAGDWQYLYLYPTGAARLQHCIVEFAGGLTAIEIQSSDVSVRDCTIRDTSGYGIHLNGAGLTPTLERVTIERSSTAIYQTTLDMQPVYRELRLRTNQVNAIFVPSSSTTRDITLDSTGLVEGMLSLGQHYIGTGTTLTVQPGSVISFRSGGWLSTWPGAASTLIAEGTPGQPIRFTSAVTEPRAGDWQYLYLYPNGAARLQHCVVEYAAQGLNTQARLLIDSCTFRSNTTGVSVANNAGGTIVNSQFSGNATAVTNNSPARPVRAFGNWWNHPSGPTHAANPGGQGDPVSNGVLYQGWLRSARPDAGGRTPTPLVLGQTVERTIEPSQLYDFVYQAAGGENLLLEVRPVNGAARVALLGRLGALPWAGFADADVAAYAPIEGVYLLSLPAASAGNHFFTILPELGSSSAVYAVTLLDTQNRIAAVTPRVHGPTESSLTVHGLFSFNEIDASLCNTGNPTIRSGKLNALSPSLGSLSMDLSGVAPGIYNLCVTWPDSSQQVVTGAIEVQPPNPQVEVRIERPTFVRALRRYTIYVHYTSTGNVPAPAPYITVDATNALISLWPEGEKERQVRLFGFNDQAPYGLLPPGKTVRVPVYLEVTSNESVGLTVKTVTERSQEPFDWAGIEADLRPSPAPASWSTNWAATIAPFGNTWGSVIRQINQYANQAAWISMPASPDTTLAQWFYNALLPTLPAPQAAAATELSQATGAIKLVCGNSRTENYYTYDYDPVADVDLQGFNAANFDEDRPTFIVIHGLHQGASGMREVLETVAGEGNVIAIDWEVGAKISTGMVFSITQCRNQFGANGPTLAGIVAAQKLRSALNSAGKTLNLDTTVVIARDAGMYLGLEVVKGWRGRAGAVWLNPPADPALIRYARSTFDPERSAVIIVPTSPTDALRSEVAPLGWATSWGVPDGDGRPKSIADWARQRDHSFKIFVKWPEDPAWNWLRPRPRFHDTLRYPPPIVEPEPPVDPGEIVIEEIIIVIVTSWDPNAKEAWRQYAMPGDLVRWTIYFENMASASAPAQEVFIVDQLPTELDWASVRLLEVGFDRYSLPLQFVSSAVPASASIVVPDYRPEVTTTLEVQVNGYVNALSGELTWSFITRDPRTGDYPEDALAGFLPPNDGSGRGEGYVTFEARIKPDVPLGTFINNDADIIFDTNEAINTGVETVIVGMPATQQRVYLPYVSR